MIFDEKTLGSFAVGVVLCCVIPVLIGAVAAFFALRTGNRWVSQLVTPDPEKAREELVKLQRANPQATQAQIVEKFINSQALRCGLIGALTSVGGVFTLPIALPVDLLASLRVQALMVQFIADAYGHTDLNSVEEQVQRYLIMTGGLKVTGTSQQVIMRYIVRLLGQTFAKFVPIVGAVVGFAVNYLFTQGAGRVAARWYSSRSPALPG